MVILLNLESLYESLYDALNQVRFHDPQIFCSFQLILYIDSDNFIHCLILLYNENYSIRFTVLSSLLIPCKYGNNNSKI